MCYVENDMVDYEEKMERHDNLDKKEPWKRIANEYVYDRLSDEQVGNYVKNMQNNDENARQQLVLYSVGFILKLISQKQFDKIIPDREYLVECGLDSLMRGLPNFDVSRESYGLSVKDRLRGYANRHIKWGILKGIPKYFGVPEKIYWDRVKLQKWEEEFFVLNGRKPSKEEIGEHFGKTSVQTNYWLKRIADCEHVIQVVHYEPLGLWRIEHMEDGESLDTSPEDDLRRGVHKHMIGEDEYSIVVLPSFEKKIVEIYQKKEDGYYKELAVGQNRRLNDDTVVAKAIYQEYMQLQKNKLQTTDDIRFIKQVNRLCIGKNGQQYQEDKCIEEIKSQLLVAKQRINLALRQTIDFEMGNELRSNQKSIGDILSDYNKDSENPVEELFRCYYINTLCSDIRPRSSNQEIKEKAYEIKKQINSIKDKFFVNEEPRRRDVLLFGLIYGLQPGEVNDILIQSGLEKLYPRDIDDQLFYFCLRHKLNFTDWLELKEWCDSEILPENYCIMKDARVYLEDICSYLDNAEEKERILGESLGMSSISITQHVLDRFNEIESRDDKKELKRDFKKIAKTYAENFVSVRDRTRRILLECFVDYVKDNVSAFQHARIGKSAREEIDILGRKCVLGKAHRVNGETFAERIRKKEFRYEEVVANEELIANYPIDFRKVAMNISDYYYGLAFANIADIKNELEQMFTEYRNITRKTFVLLVTFFKSTNINKNGMDGMLEDAGFLDVDEDANNIENRIYNTIGMGERERQLTLKQIPNEYWKPLQDFKKKNIEHNQNYSIAISRDEKNKLQTALNIEI